MSHRLHFILPLLILAALAPASHGQSFQRGMVYCANLVYANGKTSVCFSSEFLKEIGEKTHIKAHSELKSVPLESLELYKYPFAVMSGEESFTLTAAQRKNLHSYLTHGGFIVASAGCSDSSWTTSFRKEIERVMPEAKLKKIGMDHPVFHTVFSIDELESRSAEAPHLEGLEVDGKIVLILSPDGLNDTGTVGENCCCCGGSEIFNARQVNVNLLAYTLTH